MGHPIANALRRRLDAIPVHLEPERRWNCDCYWCVLWCKRQARADLEAVVPGGVEVLDGLTTEQWETLTEWAGERLAALEGEHGKAE